MAVLLLASLHVLSPEFSPSWRVISEYAFGHYGWVLSLMFLTWGVSTWALAAAIWEQPRTRAGRAGLGFLLLAGLGEAMASVFDVNHEIGHGVAGLFGVLGLPVAALLITVSLGHTEAWATVKRPLLWLAHLTWISVVLLMVTLVLMTVQMADANGGKPLRHAPKALPPGVIGLDGWADRLIVISNCLWVVAVAWQAIKLRHRQIPA
ncbi:MAG TPA: DUF998 domain-containing protein [Terriglobia bacterium]|nr:DUF998 domain-containing protein [Terriglobia bacterium]